MEGRGGVGSENKPFKRKIFVGQFRNAYIYKHHIFEYLASYLSIYLSI